MGKWWNRGLRQWVISGILLTSTCGYLICMRIRWGYQGDIIKRFDFTKKLTHGNLHIRLDTLGKRQSIVFGHCTTDIVITWYYLVHGISTIKHRFFLHERRGQTDRVTFFQPTPANCFMGTWWDIMGCNGMFCGILGIMNIFSLEFWW